MKKKIYIYLLVANFSNRYDFTEGLSPWLKHVYMPAYDVYTDKYVYIDICVQESCAGWYVDAASDDGTEVESSCIARGIQVKLKSSRESRKDDRPRRGHARGSRASRCSTCIAALFLDERAEEGGGGRSPPSARREDVIYRSARHPMYCYYQENPYARHLRLMQQMHRTKNICAYK